MFKWYRLFNYTDFVDLNIPSFTAQVFIEGEGLKTILITKGNYVGVTYDGIFLVVNMNNKNPFRLDTHAVYLDDDDVVWLGIYEN